MITLKFGVLFLLFTLTLPVSHSSNIAVRFNCSLFSHSTVLCLLVLYLCNTLVPFWLIALKLLTSLIFDSQESQVQMHPLAVSNSKSQNM